MTTPDQPGSGVNNNYFLPANRPNAATSGLSQFASADQEFWDDYAYNQWNPKFQGMGEPVDVIRLLAHAATANISAVIRNFANGWFGNDDAIGDPIEVEYTIESIKDVVMNGATVETKTSSGTWTKPPGIIELTVILISAGYNGTNGTVGSGTRPGGVGGWGGSFRAQVLDPSLLPDTIPYTVGTNGAASTFGDISVQTSVGGPQNAARGDMISFSEATPSLPAARGGTGGQGGQLNADVTAGSPGNASLLGAAGAGGTRKVNGGTAGNGGAGGNVSLTAATKCGGGGGGGGGGAQTFDFTDAVAGAGGPGGYPGGPGGGGGGCYSGSTFASGTAGAGGLGAHGVIWIIHRSPSIPETP